MANNKKSDVSAKAAFCKKLIEERGYTSAEVTASPADVTAIKDGVKWYYEIKMTKRSDSYFGAATATEWEQAFRDPDHYKFVIAVTDDEELEFKFIEFTPQDFMKACTIPPFKIYFNIDLLSCQPKQSMHRPGTVSLDEESFSLLNDVYTKLKNAK